MKRRLMSFLAIVSIACVSACSFWVVIGAGRPYYVSKLYIDTDSDGEYATVMTGEGTPESSVTATTGSLYLRQDSGGTVGGTLWVKGSGTGNTGWGILTSTLADADKDTKVQVEESADEDTIRFDAGGIEVAEMTSSGFLPHMATTMDTTNNTDPDATVLHVIGYAGGTEDILTVTKYGMGTIFAVDAEGNAIVDGYFSGTGLWDADVDTGVQVEESSDEDTIRFDAGGAGNVLTATSSVVTVKALTSNGAVDCDTTLNVDGASTFTGMINFGNAAGTRVTASDYVSATNYLASTAYVQAGTWLKAQAGIDTAGDDDLLINCGGETILSLTNESWSSNMDATFDTSGEIDPDVPIVVIAASGSHTTDTLQVVNSVGTPLFAVEWDGAARFGGTEGGAPLIEKRGETPEGNSTAPIGSLCLRTDAGGNSTAYLKTSGSGDTGWSAIQTHEGVGTGTVTSGNTSVAVTVTGASAATYCHASITNSTSNTVAIANCLSGDDICTVTLTGDPGASGATIHVVGY